MRTPNARIGLLALIAALAILTAACPSFEDKHIESDEGEDDDGGNDDDETDDDADDDDLDDDADDDGADDDVDDDLDDDADDDDGEIVDVSISTLGAYSPDPVAITVGDSVRWTNNDLLRTHTATEGNPGETDPLFDSGNLDGHGQYLFTFHEAGTYVYHCKKHSGENGMQVIVSP